MAFQDEILGIAETEEYDFTSDILGIAEGTAEPAISEPSDFTPSENVSQWSDVIDQAITDNPSQLGFNVDKDFVNRIMQQESGGDPDIESYAGAKGLMQLMDTTAENLGVTDPYNPQENVGGGVRLLVQLMERYDGDRTKVLAAYNGGPQGVDQAVEAYGDQWLAHLDEFKGVDPETGRNHAYQVWDYIEKVGGEQAAGLGGSFEDDIYALAGIEKPAEDPEPGLEPAQPDEPVYVEDEIEGVPEGMEAAAEKALAFTEPLAEPPPIEEGEPDERGPVQKINDAIDYVLTPVYETVAAVTAPVAGIATFLGMLHGQDDLSGERIEVSKYRDIKVPTSTKDLSSPEMVAARGKIMEEEKVKSAVWDLVMKHEEGIETIALATMILTGVMPRGITKAAANIKPTQIMQGLKNFPLKARTALEVQATKVANIFSQKELRKLSETERAQIFSRVLWEKNAAPGVARPPLDSELEKLIYDTETGYTKKEAVASTLKRGGEVLPTGKRTFKFGLDKLFGQRPTIPPAEAGTKQLPAPKGTAFKISKEGKPTLEEVARAKEQEVADIAIKKAGLTTPPKVKTPEKKVEVVPPEPPSATEKAFGTKIFPTTKKIDRMIRKAERGGEPLLDAVSQINKFLPVEERMSVATEPVKLKEEFDRAIGVLRGTEKPVKPSKAKVVEGEVGAPDVGAGGKPPIRDIASEEKVTKEVDAAIKTSLKSAYGKFGKSAENSYINFLDSESPSIKEGFEWVKKEFPEAYGVLEKTYLKKPIDKAAAKDDITKVGGKPGAKEKPAGKPTTEYARLKREEVSAANKDLDKSFKAAEAARKQKVEVLKRELEATQFGSELRKTLFRSQETKLKKKDKKLTGEHFETPVLDPDIAGDQWSLLIGEKTRNKAGDLITRSQKVESKLQGIADSWNLAKAEGQAGGKLPSAAVLNSVDNWSPDDVVDVIREGVNVKDFAKFEAEGKASLQAAEDEYEKAIDAIALKDQAIEARERELGIVKEDVPDFTEEVAGTAKTVDEYVEEFSPDIGFSIKDVSKKKRVNDKLVLPGSVNPEAEKRYKESHGIKQPSKTRKMIRAAKKVKRAFTRHFEDLDPKTDGVLIDILRQHEATQHYAPVATENVLRGITAGLGKQGMDVFERNITYPDILRTINEGMYVGKKLPFDYKNKEEIQTDLDNYQAIMNANPQIKDAVERRTNFMNSFRQELVDNNLLPESVLEDEAYFHRQVLQYMGMEDYKGIGTSAGDVRLKRHGYQRSRIGRGGNWNTAYLESENEVISQGIAQLETVKTLKNLMSTADITDQLKVEAKQINAEKGAQMLAGGDKKKVTYKDIIPEGYTLWQPEKGNLFYQVNSLADKAVEDILDGTAALQKVRGEQRVDASKLRLLEKKDLKSAWVMGGKKLQWVIPENLARTLDNFQKLKDEGVVGKFSKAAMDTWKQWTLLNPMGVVRYNVNNASGDTDITFAYNPKILTYAPQAAIDLANYNLAGRAPSKEILIAIKKAVVGSGFAGREIPDISKSGAFSIITGNKPGLITKYWNKIKDYTEWRENVLRLSAFRFFRAELAKGRRDLYGVSKIPEMDAMYKALEKGTRSEDDIAAKLARELLGDYGNISKAGMWMREHMMPFYSWMEINSPRYFRLVQNMQREGIGPGQAGRGKRIAGMAFKKSAGAAGKTAWKAGKLTALAAGLSAVVALWNHTFFPEEEKELGKARRQQHLILGKHKDGELITVRLQGALSDMLSYVGLEDLPYDIADVVTGKKDVVEKGKEAVEAFGSRIFNALGPQFKLPVELAAKKSTYPSIAKPRVIRDRGEHIAKTFSLQLPYKILTGKPIRGIKDELMASIVYKTDPGEQAYFDTWQMISDYKEKIGKDEPGYSPSNKSNALYYYKKSLQYKDEKGAAKWLKRYEELGGKKSGMRKSIKRSNPMNSLPLAGGIRRKFKESLTEEEMETFEKAIAWYKNVYGVKGFNE